MALACFIKKLFINSSLICLASLLASCDSDTNTKQYNLDDKVQDASLLSNNNRHKSRNILNFGFDLRASPQEDARQYLPFLAYLEKETGYKFKLHFTPKNTDIVNQVGQNHIQFAALGAVSFLRAYQKYGVIPLVRGINHKGKAEYQSVFVTLPKSKIRTLNDIKGKRLAFGARSSTQGHLIPRIVLKKYNLELKDFASYSYTGSHQNCINAVISNKADVCALQDTMAKTMANQNLVKIIHTSNYYPSSGIVVNKGVPEEIVKKVKLALVNFQPTGKDAADLYHWDRTEMPNGFLSADINDYKELNKWYTEFGFIKSIN